MSDLTIDLDNSSLDELRDLDARLSASPRYFTSTMAFAPLWTLSWGLTQPVHDKPDAYFTYDASQSDKYAHLVGTARTSLKSIRASLSRDICSKDNTDDEALAIGIVRATTQATADLNFARKRADFPKIVATSLDLYTRLRGFLEMTDRLPAQILSLIEQTIPGEDDTEEVASGINGKREEMKVNLALFASQGVTKAQATVINSRTRSLAEALASVDSVFTVYERGKAELVRIHGLREWSISMPTKSIGPILAILDEAHPAASPSTPSSTLRVATEIPPEQKDPLAFVEVLGEPLAAALTKEGLATAKRRAQRFGDTSVGPLSIVNLSDSCDMVTDQLRDLYDTHTLLKDWGSAFMTKAKRERSKPAMKRYDELLELRDVAAESLTRRLRSDIAEIKRLDHPRLGDSWKTLSKGLRLAAEGRLATAQTTMLRRGNGTRGASSTDTEGKAKELEDTAKRCSAEITALRSQLELEDDACTLSALQQEVSRLAKAAKDQLRSRLAAEKEEARSAKAEVQAQVEQARGATLRDEGVDSSSVSEGSGPVRRRRQGIYDMPFSDEEGGRRLHEAEVTEKETAFSRSRLLEGSEWLPMRLATEEDDDRITVLGDL